MQKRPYSFSKIKHTLETIEEDANLKAETRRVSEGLVRKMDQLEYGILTGLWSTIMERFNLTSKALQCANLDLNNAVNLLHSLKTYVEGLRTQFEKFEEMGKKLTENDEYLDANIQKRQRSVKVTRYDGSSEDAQLSPRDKFRKVVFLPIVDNLVAALEKRLDAYKTVCSLFGFMHNMKNMSPRELRAASEHLVKTYSSDLESTLCEEIVQFAEFVPPKVQQLSGNVEVELYRIVMEPEKNVEVALRLYLILLVSNCSGEKLKYLRNLVPVSLNFNAHISEVTNYATPLGLLKSVNMEVFLDER